MISLLEQTIHGDYHLPRRRRSWNLEDAVEIISPNRNSLAFSLDNKEQPPFDFLGAAPPAHIARMCDCVIALSYQGKCYLFVIEQQTAHQEEYRKQLINGRIFCDWLMALFTAHGHLTSEPIFVSLLIWQPRQKSPRKGTTAHRRHGGITRTEPVDNRFDSSFRAANLTRVWLRDLVESHWRD